MNPDARDAFATLFEAAIVVAIQLLIEANPELLLPPEDAPGPPSQRLRRARDIVTLARELHLAIGRYRHGRLVDGSELDDDFPF